MGSILEKLFLGEINPSEDNTVLSDEGDQKAIKRQEKLTKEMEKTLRRSKWSCFVNTRRRTAKSAMLSQSITLCLGFGSAAN